MTKWEEEVKKDYNEITKANNLDKLNFSSWKTSSLLAFIFIAIAIGIIAIANYFYIRYGYIAIAIGVIISLVFVILAILIFKARSKIAKIKNKIINALDFSYYYSLALKELSNGKYQLSSLSTEFDIAPINFWPKGGTNQNDEILNFFCNDINCSYGTITNEVIHVSTNSKGQRTETRHYTRYCYLNLRLIRSTELNAIIQQSKSFLKIFKTPDNTDLESTEFEKIYSVQADDQIMIRKLLQPKIQENLIELAYAYENKPRIAILNEEVTFAFNSFRVAGWNDPKGRVMGIKFKGKADQIPLIICEKIKNELDFLFYTIAWTDGFEFFKNNRFKQKMILLKAIIYIYRSF